MNSINMIGNPAFKGVKMTENGAYYQTHNSGKIIGGISAIIPATVGVSAGSTIYFMNHPESEGGKSFYEKLREKPIFRGKTNKEIYEVIKEYPFKRNLIISAILTLGLPTIGWIIDKKRNNNSKANADMILSNAIRNNTIA